MRNTEEINCLLELHVHSETFRCHEVVHFALLSYEVATAMDCLLYLIATLDATMNGNLRFLATSQVARPDSALKKTLEIRRGKKPGEINFYFFLVSGSRIKNTTYYSSIPPLLPQTMDITRS